MWSEIRTDTVYERQYNDDDDETTCAFLCKNNIGNDKDKAWLVCLHTKYGKYGWHTLHISVLQTCAAWV